MFELKGLNFYRPNQIKLSNRIHSAIERLRNAFPYKDDFRPLVRDLAEAAGWEVIATQLSGSRTQSFFKDRPFYDENLRGKLTLPSLFLTCEVRGVIFMELDCWNEFNKEQIIFWERLFTATPGIRYFMWKNHDVEEIIKILMPNYKEDFDYSDLPLQRIELDQERESPPPMPFESRKYKNPRGIRLVEQELRDYGEKYRPELGFARIVLDMAIEGEWNVIGVNMNQNNDKYCPVRGFPDIVLSCERRGLLAVELKTISGGLRMEQIFWTIALSRAPGIRYCLWLPSDVDEIIETLIP